MKPDRWRQVDELYAAALERKPEERAAFLDAACAGDAELRREVEEMLGSDAKAQDFIETPVIGLAVELMAGRAGKAAAEGRGSGLSSTSDSIDRAVRSQPRLAGRYASSACSGAEAWARSTAPTTWRLRQPVALKPCPRNFPLDGPRSRASKEVIVVRRFRTARRPLSDVGEADSLHFPRWSTSRGEDSPRSSSASAAAAGQGSETARQLCAGSRPYTIGACCTATRPRT